jgi:hypothetical protein
MVLPAPARHILNLLLAEALVSELLLIACPRHVIPVWQSDAHSPGTGAMATKTYHSPRSGSAHEASGFRRIGVQPRDRWPEDRSWRTCVPAHVRKKTRVPKPLCSTTENMALPKTRFTPRHGSELRVPACKAPLQSGFGDHSHTFVPWPFPYVPARYESWPDNHPTLPPAVCPVALPRVPITHESAQSALPGFRGQRVDGQQGGGWHGQAAVSLCPWAGNSRGWPRTVRGARPGADCADNGMQP